MSAEEISGLAERRRRGKGRPRITSRDKIVEAGLAIAAADPSAIVSIVAIARKLEIAPMAIYNYFPNRDALMQELSARLLEKMEIDIPAAASPFEAIGIWARATRAHFLRNPELLQILGYENGYVSGAWLAKSKELFRAMEALGFAGEELVKAIRWFWNVAMSAITVEVQERISPALASEQSKERLDNYGKDVLALMNTAGASEGFQDRLFDFHITMAIRALKSALTS
jgi:AcrR family transcriptional regulator